MTPAHGGLNLAAGKEGPVTETIKTEPIDEKEFPNVPRHPQVSPPPAGTRKSTANPNAPEDPMSIQHKVLHHLKETSRKPIESIYDLAGLIATYCASSFDENQIPEDMQFFDFFERSIGSVVRNTRFLSLTFVSADWK